MKLEIAHSADPAEIGRVFELDPSQPCTIGRDPSSTIHLRGDGTSRRHARIEKVGEAWVVYDQGSTHGVRVNDVPVKEAVLTRGDYLCIGNTLLRFDPVPIIDTEVGGDDGLTKLANRRRLREHLTKLLEEHRSVALVVFDVVGMKWLNDAHGFVGGDAFLKEMADRMRREAPPGTLLARVAGDVFGLVLEGAGRDEALALGEEFRARVCARAFIPDGLCVHARLDIGVATEPRTADAMISVARSDQYARRRRASGTTASGGE